MKNRRLKTAVSLLLAIVLVVITGCKEDDQPVISNDLRVLTAKVNEESLTDSPAGVEQDVSIELIFSHTLNTAAFESAFSISSSSGALSYTIAYSNANSIVTVTNSAELAYNTEYTIAVAAGELGEESNELKESLSWTFTVKEFVPPNVTLSRDIPSIKEAGGVATITGTLSEAVDSEVTVALAFAGSAVAADYTLSASAFSIPAGQLAGSITITAIDDAEIEGLEDVIVSIDNVTNAIEATQQEVTVGIEDNDAEGRGFIINEVLFDPPSGDAGDANGDGSRSASADEFIEFVNDGDTPVDLSGYTLYDAGNFATNTPRHVFPNGTIVPANGVYVLFGGGTPTGDFGGAMVATSSTGNMNLNNAGDQIIILDDMGNTFLTFDTAVEGAGIDFGSDQSVTRSPEISGNFTLHTDVNAALLYSPGTRADGSPLTSGGNAGAGFIINEVLFDPPSGDAGDANGDGSRSASADEFIEFVNDSGSPVDLSGYTLFDATNLATNEPRHTFPAGTVIPAGGVYVLFGGGAPAGDFGNAMVGVSTSGNMNLSNGGDQIVVKDTMGNVFLTFDTDVDGAGIDFGSDQSVSRSPDISGMFTLHQTANAALLFSPGKKVDGSNF